MARSRKGRPVDGILLLDKPFGLSSNQALQRAKHFFGAQKAGHTGSLDPMATGLLPICLGEATKFSQYLLNADKSYEATIRFGESTATGDAEGELLASSDASHLSESDILSAIKPLTGAIEQVPPMYSALKVGGQPLYKLAREGREIERQPRAVMVYQFIVTAFRPGPLPEADVVVECSKGTYIRSLAMDLGEALGVGAHLSRLRRTAVGGWNICSAVSLSTLEQMNRVGALQEMDGLLIPPEMAVNHLPRVELAGMAGYHAALGQTVPVPDLHLEGLVRLYQAGGIFLGVGEITDDGRVSPRRMVASRESAKE